MHGGSPTVHRDKAWVADNTLVGRWVSEFTVQDWLMSGYTGTLAVVLSLQEPSPGREASLWRYWAIFLLFTATVFAVRSRWLTHGFWAPLAYRLATFNAAVFSYMCFADYLPAINQTTLDRALYEIDLALFGVEPAVWLEQFATPAVTEWFAFFYFSYFAVVAVYAIPLVFFSRNAERLAHFALGTLLTFCIGNITYLLVPGYGPFRAFPEIFQAELPMGYWLTLTHAIVSSHGAKMDIFPSLHTALPLFIVLFSYHHRKVGLNRWWWVVAFFQVNIIIATVFLRWHYTIDVVAGIALALFAQQVSARVAFREHALRAQRELTLGWPAWKLPSAWTSWLRVLAK